MALTEEQLAEASYWLDQHTAAAQEIKAEAAAAARAAWEAVPTMSWYEAAATMAVAKELAAFSQAGQDVIAGSAQQFIGNVVALMVGSRVRVPKITLPPPRNGADPRLVHTRTAEAYRRAVARGKDNQEALNIAFKRAEDLQLADLTLVDRNAQQGLMDALGIVHFRRVVRPELSKTGSCGLCIAAADRVYNISDLMPLHPPSCKCIVMPVIGDDDPGMHLNERDLAKLYGDAGSTSRRDLARTRYTVQQHGEYGPVLTRAGDSFRGPSKVALEDDPERAARMLAQTLPVLQRLEAEGGPAGPLQYQRDLVARLSRIAGS